MLNIYLIFALIFLWNVGFSLLLYQFSFQGIALSPHYPQFLEHAINIFLKVLIEGEPIFIAELPMQVMPQQL